MKSHSWTISNKSGERIPNCDLDITCSCGYTRKGLTPNVLINKEDSQKPMGQCPHGVISPNRFIYCPDCRDSARAHY